MYHSRPHTDSLTLSRTTSAVLGICLSVIGTTYGAVLTAPPTQVVRSPVVQNERIEQGLVVVVGDAFLRVLHCTLLGELPVVVFLVVHVRLDVRGGGPGAGVVLLGDPVVATESRQQERQEHGRSDGAEHEGNVLHLTAAVVLHWASGLVSASVTAAAELE